MKFDERFLDELKGRLRLSDVIGRTVKLRRQGREYVGLSPFGQEKTPSFFINDEKGFYHDFSTGKHGDLISFLQEVERLSFREAVERLAAEAGLALPQESPQAAQEESRRLGLMDWLDAAGAWFALQLQRPAGAAARTYLEKRGLPAAEWPRFGLGFAPADRSGLKDHLIAKGASPGDLVEAGLLIQPEDRGSPYDRFRDRVMFPITDGRGRIVSFGGRALDPEARAKYLNGPETKVFHKGGLLYGLYDARRLLHAAQKQDASAPLAVVEGYMDVIACQRCGLAAAAPMGTALTEEQMAALWRLHTEPTLCFDADAAGRRAMSKTAARALPLLRPGRSLRFAALVGGKDPDEVLREKGEGALKEQIGAARPFVEILFEDVCAEAGELTTPERRTAFKAELRRKAGIISDPELSAAYRQDLLERARTLLEPSPQGRRSDFSAVRRSGPGRRGGVPDVSDAGPTLEGRAAARLLAGALHPVAASLAQGLILHPELIDEQLEALEVQGFGDEALERFAREIIRLRLAHPDLDSAGIGRHLANSGVGAVLKEIERAASLAQAPFALPDMPSKRARAEWSRTYGVLLELAALERAIRDAKLEGDFEALQSLKAKRDAYKQMIASGSLWVQSET